MSAFPNEAERAKYEKYLSQPLKFPSNFKTWISDWLAVNVPFIPISQISGYDGTVAQIDIANGRINMTGASAPERTWVDPSDGLGPVLNNLNKGVYFVCYGYQEPGENAGAAQVRVGVSVNGADPTRYLASWHLDLGWNNWEAIIIDLSTSTLELNQLRLKYWYDLGGGADAEFQYRWLQAMRVT